MPSEGHMTSWLIILYIQDVSVFHPDQKPNLTISFVTTWPATPPPSPISFPLKDKKKILVGLRL